jgi:N-acetylglucosamine-6-phosphate deacetylase
MRLGVAAALAGGQIVPGDVSVADGQVEAVGVAPAGTRGLAVPGFVDVQVNGFAGVDFLAASPSDYVTVAEALAATGVTAYLPTFITAPVDAYRDALRALAEVAGGAAAAESPRPLGAHLEGPFLSPDWPGAHPPEHLLAPDVALVDELRALGPVTTVTLAPERPGGLELVSALAQRGIVVHIGHTDADAATAHAAFDRGARALTHIHNAHRRFQPRDPGPAGVALTRPDVTVTAIVDGVHLAPETAGSAWLAARDRFCLITDAIAAAGRGDGTFHVGEREIHVRDGASRLADGTLAGSVVTMDRAVRELVALGASVPEAIAAATTAPAHLLGRDDLGVLTPGGRADIVVLDDELQVRRTLVAGVEITRCG